MSETPKTVNRDEDIVRLDPREHVRKRPGMYIGGTDKKAMHNLIEVLVDDSIAEAASGECNHIWITLRENNVVCIQDNGHGIETDIETKSGLSILEIVMTDIGLGRNRKLFNGIVRVSGGLKGIGSQVINALSEWFTVENKRNGYLWTQEYLEGKPQTPVMQVRKLEADETTGISFTFRPDFKIFEANMFDYEAISVRACELAYLVSGLTITVRDERETSHNTKDFQFANGMADVVQMLNENQKTLHELIHYRDTCQIAIQNRQETYNIEFALQYNDSSDTVIKAYVDTIATDVGTHIKGLRTALVDIINAKAAIIQEPFNWNDVQKGLTVGINIKASDASWESQAKAKFINPAAFDAVAKVIYDALNIEDQAIFKAIIEKCEANRRALKGK